MQVQLSDQHLIFEHTKHHFFQTLDQIEQQKIFPSKLTLKFMHKRWKNEFLKKMVEVQEQNQFMRSLEELTIRNSHFTDQDLLMVLDNLQNIKLIKLDLTSNSNTINNESFKILQNHDSLIDLKVLVLKNNQRINDDAFLIENKNLLGLEVLDLENTGVTEQGLQQFLKQFKHLKQVLVGKN